MSIASIAAQFCARPVAHNAATIDDEIKVYVATLDAFNAQGQLRSLVDSETVDGTVIGQAKTIVEHLDQLSTDQKQDVLRQLKDMTDAAEKQIMSKLMDASANSDATTIGDLFNAAAGDQDESDGDEPVDDEPAEPAVTEQPDLVKQLLAAVFGGTAQVSRVVDGVDLNKVKEIVSDRTGVDFAALRRTFNM